MDRRAALDEFYGLLAQLAHTVGGPRVLGSCTASDGWPSHGLYFFFEPGEVREDGTTSRVVRVGTHALTDTSKAELWGRLRTHRGSVVGSSPGGGNHRGSIFRLHVGTALSNRDGSFREAAASWGKGSSAPREIRDREVALEQAVSRHIGAMSVLWLAVADRHDRAAIERGCIALLSNRDRPAIDPPSASWLGHHADREAVRDSGLWNVNHVDDAPSGSVLEQLAAHVNRPQLHRT